MRIMRLSRWPIILVVSLAAECAFATEEPAKESEVVQPTNAAPTEIKAVEIAPEAPKGAAVTKSELETLATTEARVLRSETELVVFLKSQAPLAEKKAALLE